MATTQLLPNGDKSFGATWLPNTGSTMWDMVDEGTGSADDATTYISTGNETTAKLELTATPSDFAGASAVSISVRCQRTSNKGDAKTLWVRVFESDGTTAITDEKQLTLAIGYATRTDATFSITGTNTKVSWDGAVVALRTQGADGFCHVSAVDVDLTYTPSGPSPQTEEQAAVKSRSRIITPTIVYGIEAEQGAVKSRSRALSVESPPLVVGLLKSRARVITPSITYATNVEQTPIKSRVRVLTNETVVAQGGIQPTVGSRVRVITPTITAGREMNQRPNKSRARVITPTINAAIRVFTPIMGQGRLRAITPAIAFGKTVELPTVGSRARVITPTVTTPAANVIESETLPRGRSRVITPTIAIDRNIQLNPLRVRTRAISTRNDVAVELPLPTLTIRRRPIVKSIRVPVEPARVDGPLLGGFRLVSVEWISPTAIRVRFATSYGSKYRYQLYAGRCLIGTTAGVLNRDVIGLLIPSTYPVPLQVVAVDPDDILVDYGASLPPRPYNRVSIMFDASGFPADSKFVEITGSTEPGGAVDDDNLIARTEYDSDRTYSFISEPLGGSGEWSFECFGRDDKLAGGNKGAVLELSQTITAHPPDVVAAETNLRLTGTVASQSLSIDFTYPAL